MTFNQRLRLAWIAPLSVLAPTAIAQVCNATGPDITIANIVAPGNFTVTQGIDAFSAGVVLCNAGSEAADWNPSTNAHPVIVLGLFRLQTLPTGVRRLEQVGMGWAHHQLSGALQSSGCCTTCESVSGFTSLGSHCTTSSTASIVATQSTLGPRWEVNPATGVFSFPLASPPINDPLARRLRASLADLPPSGAGVGYYLEMNVVSADDAAAGNSSNNASYLGALITANGDERTLSLTVTAGIFRERAAILAWQAADPTNVVVRTVTLANDGTMLLAARATNLGGGIWDYEYALENLNSHRAVQALSLPIGCAPVTQIGFHDVSYHSGDGPNGVDVSGTDWPAVVGGGAITWATETYQQNPAANALRWGTLYNFRFVSFTAPDFSASATLTLFRPGDPSTITIPDIPAPAARAPRPEDIDGDCTVALSDLARLLRTFGSCANQPGYDTATDITRDGCTDLADLARLLTVFGA